MSKFTPLFLICLYLILFTSCKQKSSDPDIEKALADVISKFPQLPKVPIAESKFYRLIRSIKIGENGVELQLRSCPDTVGDPQKIIVVINQLKQVYAIPLFSNTYHDYWKFEFDSSISAVKPINTTFEKELNNCLNKLNLYDTLETKGIIINEMLLSLLQCERVLQSDSTNLQVIYLTNNYDLPYEKSDSCFKRLKQNWKEISEIFYAENNILTQSAYWDKINSRVYQFDVSSLRNIGKLNIKIYRLDCIYQLLSL